MTSLYYGEEDGRSITKTIKTIFSKGMLIVLAACAAAFLLADVAAGLFYADQASEAHKLTAMAMRYGSVALFFQAIYYIFHDYLQSIGRNVGLAQMVPAGASAAPPAIDVAIASPV